MRERGRSDRTWDLSTGLLNLSVGALPSCYGATGSVVVCCFPRSSNDGRRETGSKNAGMAGGAKQPLPPERWERRARHEADPARRLPGNGRLLAVADHDGPEVRTEVRFPP